MGDAIWYLPLGLLSVGIAWSIRKLEPLILQIFVAIIAPAFLSAIFACIPEWMHPSPPGEGAFGWTIILAATWAMVTVPICLITVIVFHVLQRQKRSKENQKENIEE